MKKILLILGMFWTTAVEASIECQTLPSCLGLDYKYTSCNGNNFMACPFNQDMLQCDQEALNGDFKFSLPDVTGRGWKESTDWADRFIVGAHSQTARYCSVANGATAEAIMLSHTHAAQSFAKAVLMDRRAASGATYYSCESVSEVTDDYTKSDIYINGAISSNPETRPNNYFVDGYYYEARWTIYTKSTEKYVETRPSCDSLGYVDAVSDCPGSYVKCPFDSEKVMCDMEAQAGEIKFSLQIADHDGWLLCNGRSLADIKIGGKPVSDSELATILSETGYSGKLPSYNTNGDYLRLQDNRNKKSYTDRQKSSIAAHKHQLSMKLTTVGSCDVKQQEGNVYQDYWNFIKSQSETTGYTGYNESDGETRPPSYSANIFIYTGKL